MLLCWELSSGSNGVALGGGDDPDAVGAWGGGRGAAGAGLAGRGLSAAWVGGGSLGPGDGTGTDGGVCGLAA
jgi:hypothetical protein